MENIKQLSTLIEQTCSDVHQHPPTQNYKLILKLVQSRVDMPKHSITFISKRLVIKNKKTLFIIFDLLQFLSYNCELSFFSQIASKQFLFKISGILMNKDTDPMIVQKILQTIRCMDQLFRPHEDLLPLFYQFYAGLLRKQFKIPHEYVSPYRPKQLKKYKKVQQQKKQGHVSAKKAVIEPSKSQQKVFQQIRQKILLTNQIMDNCNPSNNVKQNDLLIQLVAEIKQCQKKINQTINQNPNESIMELALASNDDIYITYRRFKDLQRNKKPEPFVLTELASDYIKNLQTQQKPNNSYRQNKKHQQKSSNVQKSNGPPRSIFDQFQNQSPKKEISSKSIASNQSPNKQAKKEQLNIFDLDIQQKKQQIPKINNAFDLMNLGPQQPHPFVFSTQNNGLNQVNNFQMLLGSMSGHNNQQNASQLLDVKVNNNSANSFQINNNGFNLNSQSIYGNNSQPIYGNNSQLIYGTSSQPIYGNNNQPVYGHNSQPIYGSNSQPIYGNISIQTNQQKVQVKSTQNTLTNMQDFKLFLQK